MHVHASAQVCTITCTDVCVCNCVSVYNSVCFCACGVKCTSTCTSTCTCTCTCVPCVDELPVDSTSSDGEKADMRIVQAAAQEVSAPCTCTCTCSTMYMYICTYMVDWALLCMYM